MSENPKSFRPLSLGTIQETRTFFVILEEAAKSAHPLSLGALSRHASSKTLAHLEDYFWYTFSMLGFLMNEFGLRNQLGLFDHHPRPKKIPVPHLDAKLLPYKHW